MFDILQGKLHQKYGADVPDFILKRFWYEWELVVSKGAAKSMVYAFTLCQALWALDCPFYLAGEVSASFLHYLLGVSSANPLPPHYYCPACHATELVSDELDGFDLPSKQCACGKLMYGDGHGLDADYFWGGENLSCMFMVPVGRYEEIVAACSDLQVIDYACSEPADSGELAVFPGGTIQTDKVLPESCGGWAHSPAPHQIRSYILEHIGALLSSEDRGENSKTREALRRLCRPITSFSAAVRYYSLMLFQWKESEDILSLFDHVLLPDAVPFREDVFDFFRIHGFTPQEASKQMNWVRKGRPTAKVIDPDGCQDFVRRYSACQYIPSKAWALEYYTALTKKHLFPAR